MVQDEADRDLAAEQVAAVRGVADGGQRPFGEQIGVGVRGAFGGEQRQFGR
ncbi:hypothetical protein ACFQY4_17930 [Catellatospora bangladeshensis]|uniref:hypothetical protein n=1 Tax=Catellatospora bangladeshensis TaxID=310355 RepID=UPI00360F84F3